MIACISRSVDVGVRVTVVFVFADYEVDGLDGNVCLFVCLIH